MITNQRHSRAISNLGFIDHGSIWVLDALAAEPETVELSDAEWLSLHPGHDDHFVVGHHYNGAQLVLTVHRFVAPGRELARCTIRAHGTMEFAGDETAWDRVPRYHVEYLNEEAAPAVEAGYWLIEMRGGTAQLQRMGWFDRDSYDLAWQGIVDVCAVPQRPVVLVSIQRDSHPVIFHPASRAVVGRVRLADRGGNPTLRFRSDRELWASDYDTLVRVDASNWVVTGTLMLQPALGDGMRQFIGEYSFTIDGTKCVVARPFSGDVVVIDAARFERIGYCPTGGEPLECVVFAGGRVACRNWKTGALLTAQL
jgi:hypothetical protein